MTLVKKILCPIDLREEENSSVVDYASTMAKKMEAQLVLVHVIPKFDEYVGAAPLVVSASAFMKEVIEDSEEKIKKILVPLVADGVKVSSIITSGEIAAAILNTAEEGEFDLIIMGTKGKSGMEGILFGSVAQKIVQTSPIPVLTLKPE